MVTHYKMYMFNSEALFTALFKVLSNLCMQGQLTSQ